MRRGWVIGCLALLACDGFAVDQDQRCEALNQSMYDCLGEGFPKISCAGMSDADIDTFVDGVEDSECEYWRDALPQDGDLRASYCRLYDDGCAAARNPAPVRAPTRYPVLMVNGIDVSFAFRYSDRIFYVMREVAGHDVRFAIVPPYDATTRRAARLWQHVQDVKAETGAEKVNLICHSLGGLDCRYLVSPGGLHWEVEATHEQIVGSVASVSMVSTAHRGTRVADAALGALPDADRREALDSIATFVGEWFTEEALEQDVDLRASVAALSTTQARAFNAQIVDADGVYYQSWGGFSRPFGSDSASHDERLAQVCTLDDGTVAVGTFAGEHDYLATSLLPSYEMVGREDDARPDDVEPNDGLCTIASAKWGRFRGCIPIDHMEQLGQLNLPDANVRTGFDVAFFYANIASELAGMGY